MIGGSKGEKRSEDGTGGGYIDRRHLPTYMSTWPACALRGGEVLGAEEA